MPGKELAIIITAPSGAGKTSVVKALLEGDENLSFSVSACTRPKRADETDGKHYHFLSLEEFKKKVDENAFIEWEEVYEGKCYGTLKAEVERIWAAGKVVVFDVDVKGAYRLKEWFGSRALAIFIKPPSVAELEKRLKARETETSVTLHQRLERAEMEMSWENKFDAVVVNRHLLDAIEQVKNLVNRFIEN